VPRNRSVPISGDETYNRVGSIGSRALIQSIVLLSSIVILALLLGRLYQVLGTRKDQERFPPPGKLIDLGTHRLHLVDSGQGSQTIVFEAGLMSTVLSWESIERELAKHFRVIRYDRAGLGWSDTGPQPRTADRIVDELRTLLERARVPPPYLLVGHSFGGITMPLFAARYPSLVAGMVLVDPVVAAEWNPPAEQDRKRIHIGSRVCRRAGVLSRYGVLRFVAFLLRFGAGQVGNRLVRLISRGAPADSASTSSPWFWSLPHNERTMASIFWIQEKFCIAIASQLERLPESAASVSVLGSFSDKPVVVLSAANTPAQRRHEHIAIAARLPRGRHFTAEKSGHWIMVDQPELVLQAIREVADFAQDKNRLIGRNQSAVLTSGS
jgi:pimeloyl-ACP methyl ester carboxylesterase